MGRLKLAKTSDSRTRAKLKAIELQPEAERLKERLKEKSSGFIDYLLERGYSVSSIERFVVDARRFEKWLDGQNVQLLEVSYSDVLHYVQGLRLSVSQRSISAMLNGVEHYFSYLTSSGLVAENPVTGIKIQGIKRRKLYDILSKQELEALYHDFSFKSTESTINQNWYKIAQLSAVRNKVIVGLLVYQGLNATELSRLTLSDLKLREGKVYVAATRRSNERELLLEAVQIIDLMEYVLKSRAELLALSAKQSDKLLISSGSGDRLNNTLSKLVAKLNEANNQVKSIKQIRTSVITHWLKHYNLREVQHMAGHRYVSSTEQYLVNDLDDLQEDISKFHPIA